MAGRAYTSGMGFFLTVPGLLLVALAGFVFFGWMGLRERR